MGRDGDGMRGPRLSEAHFPSTALMVDRSLATGFGHGRRSFQPDFIRASHMVVRLPFASSNVSMSTSGAQLARVSQSRR